MSNTIDNRVVELGFNNTQFESGIKKSLTSLNNLNNSLNKLSDNSAFDDIDVSANKVSFSSLANSVDTIASRFTTLGIIGVTALQNITNRAVYAGEQLIKSLTVDQLTTGWSKYEQKTASVQTLLNSTGESIDVVNSYLSELMWFSDETSYGFTDMTAALAQMTSSGGNVKKLIPMIEGVANAVAFAGKGASEFSRVMYNINQSYSGGFMNYMDWKSIDLAGASSKELKQTFIDTAKALGKLDEEGKTASGTLVTIANFGQTLSEKWADTDVMEKSFSAFADMSQKAYEMVKAGEVETASEAYEKLAKDYDNIYLAAARSAQEAKTFREAIDATKDAVSSGWMTTYEKIFGNYKQATRLWTDFANDLWDIFASGGEKRNNILEAWTENRGRTIFIKGLYNSMTALNTVIESVSNAFRNIFPSTTADELKHLSVKFKMFTQSLILNEEQADRLTRSFQGLFALLDIFRLAVASVVRILGLFIPSIKDLGDGFLTGAADLGDLIVGIRDYLKENDSFYKGLKKIADFVAPAFDLASNAVQKLLDTLSKLFGFDHIPNFDELSNFAKNIHDQITPITNVFDFLINSIDTIFEKMAQYVSGMFAKDGIFGNIDIGKVGLVSVIGVLTNKILKNGGLVKSIKNLADTVTNLKSILGDVSDAINDFSNNTRSGTLITTALAIGILAVSLTALASLSWTDLAKGLLGIGVLITMLSGAVKLLKIITKSGLDRSITKATNSLIKMSVAVLILSQAIEKMSKLSWTELAKGLLGFVAGLGLLIGSLWLLKKLQIKSMVGVATTLLILSSAMVVLGSALQIFSSNDLAGIGKGLLAMAGSLAILIGALAFLNKMKPVTLIASATALTLLSAGMIALGIALQIFAANDLGKTAIGIGAMVISLYALVGALALLNKINPLSLILSATALTLLSAGMIALGIALQIFAARNIEQTAVGIGAMVISLYALVGALTLLQGINPLQFILTSASILVLSAAMVVLSLAVLAMGSAGLETVGSGLIGMAGALIIFGVAGALINPAISANLMVLAVAIGLLGAAFLVFTPAFTKLANLSFDQVINGLAGLAAIIGTFAGVSALLTPVAPAMTSVAVAMDLLSAAVWIVSDAITKVSTAFTIFVDACERLANIKENLSGIGTVVKEAVGGMSYALSESLNNFSNTGQEAAQSFISGLVDTLNGSQSVYKIQSAGRTITNNANKGVQSVDTSASGAYIVDGIVVGINANAWKAIQSANNLAEQVRQTINASLRIHSPSRATMESGMFVVEGLAKGIYENSGYARQAASNVALDVINRLNDKFYDLDDYDFTIRPVLDTSVLDSQLDDLMNDAFNVRLNLSESNPAMKNIRAIVGAKTVRENAEKNQNGTSGSSSTWAPTFNQYNYSPKALSRSEIYRQTRNQFSAMKGVVKT